MENASKALIIAGAILISILLISVGIIIINAINNPIQSGVNEGNKEAIQMFNSNFVSYEGTQKGSNIRALASIINASNGSDNLHQVRMSGQAAGGAEAPTIAGINPNTDYTVTLNYFATGSAYNGTRMTGHNGANPVSEAGYIYEIVITP